MAVFITTTGVQALLDGAAALADRQQMDLSAQVREDATVHRQYEVLWRKENVRLKNLEKYRRKVDHKRHLVNEKTRQLSLLAELSALQAAFQMIMLYEQELPSVTEVWYADPLLAVWGVGSLSVACVDLCIMAVAAFVNFDVLEASCREGVDETTRQEDLYTEDGRNPEGIIVAPELFLHMWYARYDDKFRAMVLAFSYTVPIFMLNLGFLTLVKFYQSTLVAWICFVLCLSGVLVWFRCHNSLISHLIWRPWPEKKKEEKEKKKRRRAEQRQEQGGARRVSWCSSVSSEGAKSRRGSAVSSGSRGRRGSTVASCDGDGRDSLQSLVSASQAGSGGSRRGSVVHVEVLDAGGESRAAGVGMEGMRSLDTSPVAPVLGAGQAKASGPSSIGSPASVRPHKDAPSHKDAAVAIPEKYYQKLPPRQRTYLVDEGATARGGTEL